MKTAAFKLLFVFLLLGTIGMQKLQANGCTGSWFQMQYSPWCNCWQVCGNYISDCDEIVSISWNFGDGTTATGESPCHTFPGPGTYTVTMTIVAYCHNSFFNLFTTTCNITQQVTVTANQSPLQANFATDTVCLGAGTQFTNTTVSPSGSNTYQWIWPDGTVGSGPSPTFTFDSCGAYDVTLIVSNTTPCCSIPGHDTITKRVYIDCPPFAESNNLGDNDPYIQESDAFLSVTSGTCAGDTTHFLINTNGPIDSWLFVFPDSTTSTAPNPTYVYTACPPAVDYTYVNINTNRGCTAIIDSVTGIFCPSNINLSATTTLCTGQCSGTATVSLGGGTPPYTVQWSDPGSQTTLTATGLCPPGPYNVTVTDGNGCTATPNQGVVVPDFPDPFVGTVTVLGNVLCYGFVGGSASLQMTGGTPPYQYIWPDGTTGSAVINLPGGTNYVTGTDAHGCTFTTPFVINQPPPITATFNIVNASCGVCNGTATATASGGQNSGYYYYWQTVPPQTGQTAHNLCAGVYTVIIEDATVSGCQDTFSVSINENGSQAITASSTNATCSNICNGSGTVNFTGGCLNAPCSVQWLDSTGVPIPGQTNATANNLCEGNYIVEVTNGLGCHSFANISVGVPNPIIPNTSSTANSCGANCSGTATVTAAGGNPPYTYQWYDAANTALPGQTNAMATNLCGGTYHVSVTDQQGCIVSDNALVLSSLMTASATATDVRCNGDCSGIITAAVQWGIQPYTFTVKDLSNVTVATSNSPVIANLCAGSYNLLVSDSAGCTLTLPVTINQPAPLNLNPTANSPLCYGNCNGSVAVLVTGGTAPYTYDWRNSNGVLIGTVPSISSLCADNYAVKVVDTNGCVFPYIPVVLTQPAPLDDSMQIIDPYCTAGLGSINLSPYGGTAPYSFNWSNNATTEDISNLSSGTYAVTITDVNNCITYDTAVFVQLPLLTESIHATLYHGYHFKCSDNTDGEVIVDVAGGLPPYTYLWNDSAASTVDSIYGLPPGTYTVTVTDAQGCVRVDSIPLNLVPPPFSLTNLHNDVLCNGDSSGAISLVPQGGVPPYVYYWLHDTSLVNTPLTNIGPGQYIAICFDSIFCLRSDTIDITEPPLLTVSHSITNVTCNGGNDGAVDITPAGGITPYGFNWNNGQFTTEDISGVTAGTYIVNILDSNNCLLADTALITEPAAIQTSLAVTGIVCNGDSNGAIDLTVNGGQGNLSYDWNNGQFNTQDLQNIPAGIYSVTVTDAANCSATNSATLNDPPVFTLSETHQDILCAGANSGSITITTGGGVLPHTYYWQHDTTIINTGLNGVAGGTYIVIARDSNGCQLSDTITLAEPAAIQISKVVTDINCFGAGNGTVNLTVNGGVQPYTFNWNNNQFVTEDISGLSAGQYIVVVTDSNNCIKRDTSTIKEPLALATNIDPQNISCFGGNDGSLDLTVTGGTIPYGYNWNNGQFNTQDLQNVPAGTYSVLVSDSNNCTATDAATLSQPNLISGSRPVSICAGDSFFTQGAYQTTAGAYVDTLTAPNGCDSVLTTNLSFVNGFSSQFQETVCYGYGFWFNGTYYMLPGSYTDTLKAKGGCDSVVTLNLNVLQDINAYADPDHANILLGDTVGINIYTGGPSQIVSYTWLPPSGLDCNNCATVVASPAGDIRYRVIVVDTNGCSDTVIVPISVHGPVLYIPNVFTPNGDGNNDFFEIFGDLNALRFLEVKVFDRWGEKVFESNDLHFKWDGTFKGKAMMPAVFVYIVKATFADGKPQQLYKGSVTLMK